jgi:membrane protein DedA with SNARE-associated domain
MLLESALIPIPSEIIMPFSGFLVFQNKLDFASTVLVGTFGNLAGSIMTYYLGKYIRRDLILKYGKYVLVRESHLQFAEQLFQKHGSKISFVGRLLPGVRTYVSLPAGIGNTPFKKFVFYTFIGSLIWNFILVYAGMQLGNNWKNIDRYSPILDGLAIIAIIGFVIWFIRNSKKFKRDNIGSQKSSSGDRDVVTGRK